jgi:hypothetical protein
LSSALSPAASWGQCPRPRIDALQSDLVRHELFLTMAAAPPETLNEIVDDIFLPLATNFGNSSPSAT